MAQRLFRLACAGLIGMLVALEALAAPLVWIALAEAGGPYAEVATALRAELAQNATLVDATWQGLLDTGKTPPDLIVTVGVAALDGAMERLAQKEDTWARVPVLATLLPQAIFEARRASPVMVRRPFSAVVLDQPFERQLALIRRALPDRSPVGILPGPQTLPGLGAVQKAAGTQKLKLAVAPVITVSNGIYPALKAVLEEAQVILALPDPLVFNATSLQNILLTTYRARVPLVAFSAAHVKAGAVIGLYATPAQTARQAAEMVRSWLGTRNLPPFQSTREFTVAINTRVAASLGLSLEVAEQIAEDLRRQEAGR